MRISEVVQSPEEVKEMIGNGQPFLASERFCAAFHALAIPQKYTAGANVFVRGEPARGVFLVSSGRIALSVDDAGSGKEAGPGSALGLPGTVGGIAYVLSARAIEDAELGFVPCEQFLKYLKTQPDLSLEVVQMLGVELQSANRAVLSQVRDLESVAVAVQSIVGEHTGEHPIGLRRARQLLTDLKAAYDGLSRASQGVIITGLRSCAESQGLSENIAQPH